MMSEDQSTCFAPMWAVPVKRQAVDVLKISVNIAGSPLREEVVRLKGSFRLLESTNDMAHLNESHTRARTLAEARVWVGGGVMNDTPLRLPGTHDEGIVASSSEAARRGHVHSTSPPQNSHASPVTNTIAVHRQNPRR